MTWRWWALVLHRPVAFRGDLPGIYLIAAVRRTANRKTPILQAVKTPEFSGVSEGRNYPTFVKFLSISSSKVNGFLVVCDRCIRPS